MRSASSPRAVSRMTGSSERAPDPAAELEPVDAGEHDVEDHEAGALALDELAGRVAVAGLERAEAVPLEIAEHHLADDGLVVDDENGRAHPDIVGDISYKGMNSPRAWLHYDSHGAIAQLGERLDRTQEVAGSSPASSMKDLLMRVLCSLVTPKRLDVGERDVQMGDRSGSLPSPRVHRREGSVVGTDAMKRRLRAHWWCNDRRASPSTIRRLAEVVLEGPKAGPPFSYLARPRLSRRLRSRGKRRRPLQDVATPLLGRPAAAPQPANLGR